MKPLTQNSSGKLRLSVGITHVIGYRVTGYHSPSRAEFDAGIGTYVIEQTGTKIEAGSVMRVSAENPPLDRDFLQKNNITEAGVIVQVLNTAESYYIQEKSFDVIDGLE